MNVGQKAAVLQAQGVTGLVKAAVAVRQAAGLGALTPVAGPSADDGGQVALTGVAHAQSAVDKDLDLHGTSAADELDGVLGQFPGKDHAAAAQFGGLQHPFQRVDAHLGGGVAGHFRGHLAAQPQHAQILHDEGVHTGGRCLPDQLGSLGHLPVREKNI